MSQQALDLRRSVQIIRRHRAIVGAVAAVGFLAGIAFGVLHPAMYGSKALVLLPQSTPNTATEVVVAGSDPVLSSALPTVGTGMSLQEMRRDVQIKSMTSNILSITATGKTAAQAQAIANAVANSYVTYVSSPGSPVGRVSVRVLQQAVSSAATPLAIHLLVPGLAGGVAGALIGIIIALAITRHDRLLRERDEIANSIGVPVLASVPASHPSDAAGWMRLLDEYEPPAVHAWRLRKALQQLGMISAGTAGGMNGSSHSLAVLSLSGDPAALAIGPQLAALAASLGIPTTLIIGPQQAADATATLRTACATTGSAASRRSGRLRIAVAEDGNVSGELDAPLTIVVVVVDSHTPRVPETMRTAATVLSVSAGAATADQLARAAVSAALAGREVAGIVVANPDPADRTTGRVPQLAQPARRRLPTRLTGTKMELKR